MVREPFLRYVLELRLAGRRGRKTWGVEHKSVRFRYSWFADGWISLRYVLHRGTWNLLDL